MFKPNHVEFVFVPELRKKRLQLNLTTFYATVFFVFCIFKIIIIVLVFGEVAHLGHSGL